MTKETVNAHGVDLTGGANAPKDIPPRTLGGGAGAGRQLKVTAHCHSTVKTHYPSCRPKKAARLPHMMDRWQSSLLYCSTPPLVSVPCVFSGILFYKKVSHHIVCTNSAGITGITSLLSKPPQTQSWLMMVLSNFHHSQFSFWGPGSFSVVMIYSQGSVSGAVCSNGQWALCIFDEGRGWKGDLGRQQVCFFSAPTSALQAINRGGKKKQRQQLWFWFTPVAEIPKQIRGTQ